MFMRCRIQVLVPIASLKETIGVMYIDSKGVLSLDSLSGATTSTETLL